MTTHTWWETVEHAGSDLFGQLKKLLAEGNIRRVRIRRRGRLVAEFPLTVGIIGAVFAPMLAAIGAVTALVTGCTLEVERETTDDDVSTSITPPPGPAPTGETQVDSERM